MTEVEIRAALATIRAAEQLAAKHDEPELVGDLYGLGCWLGGKAVSVRAPAELRERPVFVGAEVVESYAIEA